MPDPTDERADLPAQLREAVAWCETLAFSAGTAWSTAAIDGPARHLPTLRRAADALEQEARFEKAGQALADAARSCYSVVDWPEPDLVAALEAWNVLASGRGK